MALKIRLRQQGRKNHLVYRLVLSDTRSPRDGKYIEQLGWYNPHAAEAEKNVKIVTDRLQHWLDRGAEFSEKAEQLVARGAPELMKSYRQKQVAAKAKACVKRKVLKKKKEVAAA